MGKIYEDYESVVTKESNENVWPENLLKKLDLWFEQFFY